MNIHQNYIVDSLELHLFFARIMKEHAFFLKVGFMPPNADLAKKGEHLMRKFETLLSRAIKLSNCIVRNCVLESGEIFTEFTDCAERQTQHFTGTFIDRNLTADAIRLKGCDCNANLNVSQALIRQVRQLNRDGLNLIASLITFKEQLLRNINSCSLFTSNYPLLIEHILREARLYRDHMMRLEGLNNRSCNDLRNSELFWNQIMMEHAMFIRGLLDPSEDALINTADNFADDYRRLLETSVAANNKVIRSGNALLLTRKFRDFKQEGFKGIEACKIRSIILPLLADHVLREANHYIRILEN